MRKERFRVVIVGGGVAAVETLLALRALAGDRVELTLLSPERELLYRPVTVAEAFGRGEAHAYDISKIVDDHGAHVIEASLAEVDADRRLAITDGGERLRFDHLVIATGAITRESLAGALTFRGRGDVPALRSLLDEMLGGQVRSVAFAAPSARMWTLPIYELALMTAAYVREQGVDAAEVSLVTPEEEPLELFGPAGGEAIKPLLTARGVLLRTSSLPSRVRGRALEFAGAGELYADRVVTLPLLHGPAILGLPCDARGFVPVDSHGRIEGVDHVYAAGDVTAFPLKQGGLATQQADAVAEAIAADLGVPLEPKPFRPVLRGLLITGGAPLYLRAEPQRLLRDATVAIEQRPRRPVGREASSAAGQPLWWPPAKIAGRYLAPYLAAARPRLEPALLSDRSAVPGSADSDVEYHDALELALLLADCDARWGDHRSALDALDAAEALEGALPPAYEAKRREWRAAERTA